VPVPVDGLRLAPSRTPVAFQAGFRKRAAVAGEPEDENPAAISRIHERLVWASCDGDTKPIRKRSPMTARRPGTAGSARGMVSAWMISLRGGDALRQ